MTTAEAVNACKKNGNIICIFVITCLPTRHLHTSSYKNVKKHFCA